MSDDWETFGDPRFAFRFRYPALTPVGVPVRKLDYEPGDEGAVRVHVLSEGREVYFEMTRYPATTPEEEYARHRPYLEGRWSELEITDLEEAELAGRPARRYVFRWAEGERTALLVPVDGDLYRWLYNSELPLNSDVLATVEFVAR